MEELDLKKIWKSGEGKERKFSSDKINRIIDQKPQNIVFAFVRNLKIELWLNLIVLTALSIGLTINGSYLSAIAVLLVDALFFLYYKNLIADLSKEFIDMNVVDYLNEVHKSICRFIKHFKITLALVGGLSFCIGFFTGYSGYADDNNSFFNTLTSGKLIFVGSVVVLALGLAFIFFYYMYGKKAKQIKQMVDALKEEESMD